MSSMRRAASMSVFLGFLLGIHYSLLMRSRCSKLLCVSRCFGLWSWGGCGGCLERHHVQNHNTPERDLASFFVALHSPKRRTSKRRRKGGNRRRGKGGREGELHLCLCSFVPSIHLFLWRIIYSIVLSIPLFLCAAIHLFLCSVYSSVPLCIYTFVPLFYLFLCSCDE